VSTKWISWYECSDVRWQWIPCHTEWFLRWWKTGSLDEKSPLEDERRVEYHRSGRDLLNSQKPCCGIQLYIMHSLYWIRLCTGSQCNCWRNGLTWARELASHSRMAAQSWTRCRRHNVAECILHTGCCSSPGVTILVHKLAREVKDVFHTVWH